MTAVVWLLVMPFAVWAVLRFTGWMPGFRWVQLVSFTPYVAAAAFVVPLIAFGLRRWAPGAVAVALAAFVVPRAFAQDGPAAQGPVVRVLSANLLHGGTPPARIVELAKTLQVDLLSLQELNDRAVRGLDGLGLRGMFPYVAEGAHGTALYSRLPLEGSVAGPPGSVQTLVRMPGREPFAFVAVHTCAPLGPSHAKCFADSQRTMVPATPDGVLRIQAGDFNATLDHPTIRALLATGYRDAGRARGDGFKATWPALDHTLPGVVIDHVLADRRVAVTAYSVHDLPRSDHRAVFAELRLP
ncbi:endonuclease/exonuclease/phosphatase family protein [Actinocorallia lasiicapitis]